MPLFILFIILPPYYANIDYNYQDFINTYGKHLYESFTIMGEKPKALLHLIVRRCDDYGKEKSKTGKKR